MQDIKLKDFQVNVVYKLLDATSIGEKKEILLKAPTGSGKTIILLSFIEEYLKENKNSIIVWLTPGKGDLEEQSRSKMNKFLPRLNSKDIQNVLLQGFDAKDTAFINWETVTKKGNTALKEAERKNLYERIHEAHNNAYKFIVIVDEEHINKTIKAEAIIDSINPEYVIRVSATAKTNNEAENIVIKDEEVINAGLITRALYINENVSNQNTLNNEHEYLLNLAINKRKSIHEEYLKQNIQVNPLIIIQIPNKSDDLVKQIETILEEKLYTYDRKNLAIWLADKKENILDISNNENHVSILIMKQAISTGWDCPRAKILVKLRDNMNEDFEIQTIGRIRRMPQATHYDNILLDNCYLYTFDEKYEESVKNELGISAYDFKVIFLKDNFKNISLIKSSVDSRVDKFDEKATFKILYDYFIEKYNLTNKKKNNLTILEANKYVFKDTIDRDIIQGKFVKLEDINESDRIKIQSEITTNKTGFDLRNAINLISTKIGMRPDRTRVMLERLFYKNHLFSRKFIDLSLIGFYAFVINNVDLLKYDFLEAVSQKSRQMKLKFEEIKESQWQIPEMDYIKYDANMKDTAIYEKSVFKDYPNSTIKSNSERMFEFYCENSDNVKWFYKNGESSKEYFSISYNNAVNKISNFYPDYIICDNDNNIWIIETKGGETTSGESKNIDVNVENKFIALKEYAKKYKVKFGFVRDYDKNNSLYICNNEYTESMETENWKLFK